MVKAVWAARSSMKISLGFARILLCSNELARPPLKHPLRTANNSFFSRVTLDRYGFFWLFSKIIGLWMFHCSSCLRFVQVVGDCVWFSSKAVITYET